MFTITNEQKEQLLKYLIAKPYAEVAQIVAMVASLKPVEEKDDKSKKDMS
jgi:hypothetical protein